MIKSNTLSKADQAIYSAENMDLFTINSELNNDHLKRLPTKISYWLLQSPTRRIYNCKISLINERRRHRTQSAVPLQMKKKDGWILFDKDKAFYEEIPGGADADGNPFTGWMGDQWRFSWSDNDYPRNLLEPCTDALSWNATTRTHKGGTHKTLYVDSDWIRENRNNQEAISSS